MATIRKTPSGEYQAIVRLKSINKSKVFKLKSDANRWANQIETEIEQGIFVDKRKAENTLMREICDRYVIDVLPKLKGAASDQSRIKLISEGIGKYSLIQINSVFLAKFRDELHDDDYSDQSVIHFLNMVSRLFKFASDEMGLPVSIPYVRKPKKPNGRHQRVTDDEIKAIIDASESIELKSIITFAVETAARRSEISGMIWANVHYPTVLLVDTKNGENRTVPMSEKAIATLKSLPRNIGGKVFSITPDSITQAFDRARDRCNSGHIRFHDLRHEAISRLAKRVPNVIELSAISGHKDLQTLGRYYHTDPLELAKKLG